MEIFCAYILKTQVCIKFVIYFQTLCLMLKQNISSVKRIISNVSFGDHAFAIPPLENIAIDIQKQFYGQDRSRNVMRTLRVWNGYLLEWGIFWTQSYPNVSFSHKNVSLAFSIQLK